MSKHIMSKHKSKTYMDALMKDERFREEFDKEFPRVLVSEQIAKLRISAHLTQEELAGRIHTTKSAISRYESAAYANYSLALLRKIAHACGAELEIRFVPRRTGRPAGVSEPKARYGKKPGAKKKRG